MPAIARWRRWRPAAEIAANRDFYLTRLPLTGTVQAQFAAWVEAAVVGDRAAKLIEIHRGEGEEQELLGRGYEFERPQTAVVGEVEHTWTERVQVIRSESAAASQAAALDRRLKQAEAAVRGLTPPVGPGRTQFTTGWELERAVKALLAEQEATGLLTVTWERQETVREHYVGPGRGGPNRRKTTERGVRYQITSVTRDERGDRTPGGADGLAGAGDQRGGVAAVAGGFGAGLPGGDVRGACVPPVEGPAAGDPPAVTCIATTRSGA